MNACLLQRVANGIFHVAHPASGFAEHFFGFRIVCDFASGARAACLMWPVPIVSRFGVARHDLRLVSTGAKFMASLIHAGQLGLGHQCNSNTLWRAIRDGWRRPFGGEVGRGGLVGTAGVGFNSVSPERALVNRMHRLAPSVSTPIRLAHCGDGCRVCCKWHVDGCAPC